MRRIVFRGQVMLLALMLPGAAGCVQSPVISATKAPCSSLIPDDWRKPVENAALPESSPDPLVMLKNWIAFGTAQTGQLAKANGRGTDSITIVERCEERDRAAVEKSHPKFLGLF